MDPTDPTPVPPFPRLSFADLQATKDVDLNWLWDGYLASHNVTLMTGQWKCGKSTLIAHLLGKMKAGGELVGKRVAPGKVLIVTEEDRTSWARRSRTLSFGDHLSWFCRPFLGKPTEAQWLALLDQVARIHEQERIDLLVIDPLANLTPMRSENEAGEMTRTILPLQQLTTRGMSVLLAHHPRKGAVVVGQAARGSGSLPAFVDVSIEMYYVSTRHALDCRRRLRTLSRHDDSPPVWVIELLEDGSDYRALGISAEIDFEHGWPILRSVLEKAEGPMKRRDLLREWPAECVPPTGQTLWRWLARALKEGLIQRDGDGTKRDPFTYRLPGMLEKWQEVFIAEFNRRLEQGPDFPK